jgi:hypothetical protein
MPEIEKSWSNWQAALKDGRSQLDIDKYKFLYNVGLQQNENLTAMITVTQKRVEGAS